MTDKERLIEAIDIVKSRFIVREKTKEQQSDAYFEGAIDALNVVFKAAESTLGHGWRTMESAPRDGTRIFGYFPRGKIRAVIAWRENVYEAKGDPNWTTDDGESANLTYDPPTHWMPLPLPPEEGKL